MISRIARILLLLCAIFCVGLLAGAVFGRMQAAPVAAEHIIIDHTATQSAPDTSVPRAIVVPHHLVAQQIITDTFTAAAATWGTTAPDRIVLVSPNHFNKGTAPIALSPLTQYANGATVPVDTAALRTLDTRVSGAAADSAAFAVEHGIYEILPLVAAAFPRVPVLAVALRDTLPTGSADALAHAIAALPGSTLLVLSADFSHELDNSTAQLHDMKSLDILTTGDVAGAATADIDTHAGLRVLLGFTQRMGATAFHLVGHTNSSQLGGRNVVGETTSHIAGYFSAGATPDTSSAGTHVTFTGDVMLDRDVRTAITAHNGATQWLTAPVRRAFLSTDATVLNLEGPVTDNPSRSVGSAPGSHDNYIFTFDPTMTRAFLGTIPRAVPSLGNNHVLNMGDAGFTATRNTLAAADIPFFGAVGSWQQTHTIRSTHGPCVTLVGYNAFYKSPDAAATADTIRHEAATCKVVVYAHWGAEYDNRILPSLQNASHAWIDAGATAVIGSHSHVVGAMEVYKGRPVLYSLGNFVFDQTFARETQQGLIASLRIETDRAVLTLLPTTARSLAVSLATGAERDAILGRLLQYAAVPDDVRSGIRTGAPLTFPL